MAFSQPLSLSVCVCVCIAALFFLPLALPTAACWMLFTASRVSEGTPLAWCDPLIGRFVASRGNSNSPQFAPGGGCRPPSDPVDLALVQLTCDQLGVMCSAAGHGARRYGRRRAGAATTVRADSDDGDDAVCPFDWVFSLGTGSFGTVLLAQSCQHPTRFFAAKSMTKLFPPSTSASCTVQQGGEQTMVEVLRRIMCGEACETLQHSPSLCDFVREAQVAVSLPPHPHIARCYGVVFSPCTDDKRKETALVSPCRLPTHAAVSAHMVMELGAGGTLGEFFKSHMVSIAEEHLVCWLGQLLSGLACMHKGGVLHRDIKPSNIAVRHHAAVAWESDTELIFLDFGIATVVADSLLESERTLMGSDAYLPPEIARYWGYRRRCPYTYASDMWSTAAIFYVFLTCGGSRMDEGMSAVFFNGAKVAANVAVASQLWVARGEYPPLTMLRDIPLMDDMELQLAQQKLASQRAGHTADCGEEYYTRYTTMSGGMGETVTETVGVSEWPAWVYTPSAQFMARNVQAREVSRSFLQLIDAMMAPKPADRPTAEKLLLSSPVFGMRMPWWEKVVEATVQRIVGGEEDVLLDVCVGDSDEEEEEDEEEVALMRRTMTPLIVPAENNGYIPHNVIHWWHVNLTKGERDLTRCMSPTSFLGFIFTTLRSVSAFEICHAAAAGDRRRIEIYTVTAMHFVERIFVPVRDTDISDRSCCKGPLRQELEARGLDTSFFVHVQVKLRALATANMVLLTDDGEEEDAVDEEEMARRAMEELVEVVELWIRRREVVAGESALHALPWVSWHLSKEMGTDGDSTVQRCFVVEYVVAAPRENAPQKCGVRITGDIASVFREWRANLTDGLRCSLHDVGAVAAAAASATAASSRDGRESDDGDVVADQGQKTNVRQRGAKLSGYLEEWLEVLDDAELQLQEEQQQEILHQGLFQNRVTHWLCVRPAPTVEVCAHALKGMTGGSSDVALNVDDWISCSLFTAEGAVVLRPGVFPEASSGDFAFSRLYVPLV